MTHQVFQIYDFKIDSRHTRLTHRDQLLSDDEKLIRLLKALIDQYPKAISKQELLDLVWGEVVVSEASLAKLVSEGRRLLLNHETRELIKTVHGKGYRLVAEPRLMQSGPALKRNDGDAVEKASFEPSISHELNSQKPGRHEQANHESASQQGAASAEQVTVRSYGLAVLVAVLVLSAFTAGAYFLPREKAPDSVLGRWQLIDNNVVLHTEINADGYPFCEDTIEYLNATLIQRNGSFILRSPLLEINLGLAINYGEPLNANFSYRDGTGTTHTQLKIIFDSPQKLVGKSSWTWEMDGTGVLCKGVSSMVSER